MSYFIASLLSAFTLGVIVGVMLEHHSRRYFVKEDKED